MLRSFRDGTNRELIRWGAQSAAIHGEIERGGVRREIELEVAPKGKRAVLDGKLVTRSSGLVGQLHVVVFGPDDLALTKAGPHERRRFLDRAVFNVWPAYLNEIRAYHVALKSRNELLRQRRGATLDPAVIASFDQELAQRGARVVWRRMMFLAGFRPLLQATLSDMTGGGLEGTVSYAPAEIAKLGDGVTEDQLLALLSERLERSLTTDVARGYTTVGPHADDLAFSLAGRSVRRFASQGQHRAFVLALKIAELQRIEQALGVYPVLLLDDVSSELDRDRNAHLMRFLNDAGGQVFVTTTDRRWIQLDGASHVYRVSAGRVVAGVVEEAG